MRWETKKICETCFIAILLFLRQCGTEPMIPLRYACIFIVCLVISLTLDTHLLVFKVHLFLLECMCPATFLSQLQPPFLLLLFQPLSFPPVFSENLWMKLPFKSQQSRTYLFQEVNY